MAVETIWKINGLELELDMSDYETAVKYEEAFARMAKEEKERANDGNAADVIKSYAMLFYNLFDRLFGTGTSERLFDGKYNARRCDEVYEDFLGFVHKQNVETQTRRAELVNKYRPNRAARRAKK